MRLARTPAALAALAPYAALALSLCAAAPAGAAHRPNPHAELDCNFCHSDVPRFGVDTKETVNFWRAEGDEPWLCERCHEEDDNFHPLYVAPGPERLGTRTPEHLPLGATEQVKGLVVCTTCHFLHAADADHALLRGFAGSEDPGRYQLTQDFCRECHGEGLEKRSPHAGDERSCAFCHAAKPEPGQQVTVLPVGRLLCEFCHGPVSADHYRNLTPFSGPRGCSDCHDPHLGPDHPGRIKAGYYDAIREEVTIDPHGRRTTCFTCHADPAGKTLRGPDAVAVCLRCHGLGKITSMSHPMTPVPAGYVIPEGWPLTGGRMTCVTCHQPGHPGESGIHMLRFSSSDRAEVCRQCHPAPEGERRNPHREVAERKEGCEACHEGKPVYGTDTRETVKFRAGINLVCLNCHDPEAHPGGVNHTIVLRPGGMLVPESFPLGQGRQMTCATCHNPHIFPDKGTNLRGLRDPQAFCTRCHRF